MVGAGCICVVCMGLDESGICSTSPGYESPYLLGSLDRERHVRPGLFLREPVANGAVEIEDEALARSLGVVGTVVSSCSSSSLAVPVVEFELLSADRRDMISSRVDALRGRKEKKEESAVERILEARFDTLGGVETVARE